MKKFIRIKLLVVTFLILAINTYSFTIIEKTGNITANETWSADTIKVTGDIIIDNGVTLTINPGVVVQFQEHYKINVQGRILAQGTKVNKIKFTAKNTELTETSGGWYGIRFEETPQTNDTSKIEHCHFEYGNAFGSNSLEWSGGAIALIKVQRVKITNCKFENNKQFRTFSEGAGILCYHSKTIITNNEFINNYSDLGGSAISCLMDSSVISNNVFSGNDSRIGPPVVNFNNSRCYFSNNLIVNNDRADYTYGEIVCENYSSDTLVNNTITDNLGYGITMKNSSPVIINSIIVNNDRGNLVQDATSQPTISYCNIGGVNLSDNGNFDKNPLFIGEGEDPYSLQGVSPCLNKGNPNWTLDRLHAKTDLAGNARIYSGTEQIIDIGAYELQNNPDSHLLLPDINNVYLIPDSSYIYYLEIYSYPITYSIDIINTPDGLSITNDTIKWQPNSSQKKTTFVTGFAFDNGVLKDTIWVEYRVLGDNEYAQLPNEDVVWSADTIKVYGDLKVETGKTLTINPGVYVEFQNNYGIDIDGRVLAEGFPDNKITFTSNDTVLTDSSGGWNGIRLIEITPENDTSKFDYCIFSYGNAIRESNLGSDRSGGALAFSSITKASVKNSLFRNNRAGQNAASGGAIYIHRSNILVFNNVFDENYSYKGGALECLYDTSTIAKNIFKNNSCEFAGSALNLEFSYTNVTNNLAYNNSGNGIYISYSYDTLSNNTFSDNPKDLYTSRSAAVIRNCYIEMFVTFNANDELTHCNIRNRLVEGEGNISAEPYFKKSETDYYSLDGYSPCINAGIPDFIPNPVLSNLDLANNSRIDNFVNGKRIDIGAYEYNGSALACPDQNVLITENTSNGALLDTIKSYYYSDNTLTYSVLSGNTKNIIALEPATGKIYIADSSQLDYELNDSLLFEIQVSDGIIYDTLNYWVLLNNENEPCSIADTSFTILENVPMGTVIGLLTASDKDSDPLYFSVLSGNNSGAFSLNSASGLLNVNNSELFNYEIDTIFKLNIQVSDGEFLDSAIVTVHLTDVEEKGISPFQGFARSDAVSFVIDSTVYIGLGENNDSLYNDFWSYNIKTDSWTEVAKFPGVERTSATAFVVNGRAYVGLGKSKNPTTYYKDFYEYSPLTNSWKKVTDFGGSARYDAVYFLINDIAYVGTGGNETGELKDFWKYNYETDEWTEIAEFTGDKRRGAVAFEIGEKGYVSGGLFFDSYSVQLSDVQEYNPETNTWNEKIFADGINLSFYSATVISGDKEAFICYGNKNKVVRYSPETNEVEDLGNIMNFNQSRWNSVSFVLGDSAYIGLGYYTQGFDTYYPKDISTIALPFGPTEILLSNNNFDENQNETVPVGQLSSKGFYVFDEYTYSFVSGEGDTDNNLFILDGDTLFAIELNFENKRGYSIRLRSTNQRGDFVEEIFPLTINDVNEPPTEITLSNNTVDEENEIGIEIGTFFVQDEDNTDTVIYKFDNELINNSNYFFSIEGNILIADSVFNYEEKNIYLLGVKATDKGGLSINRDFYIYIEDLEEVSVVERASDVFRIYPNPVSSFLRIEAKNELQNINSINLYDVHGRTWNSQNSIDGSEFSVDVSDIPRGVYYLVIKFEDKTLMEKVIIE